MLIRQGRANRRKLSWKHIAAYVGLVVGFLLLVCLAACLVFPDIYSDGFLKRQITRGLAKAFPEFEVRISGLHYNVWRNRLWCDSITLETIDSTFSCSASPFSLSGVRRTEILLRRAFVASVLRDAAIDGQRIVFNFRKFQNELRFKALHVSVPDSVMVIDSVTYHPLIDDKEFFAKSTFRRTRYRYDVPQIEISGLDCLALLQGNIYIARSITMHHAIADILVDMYKPYFERSSNPQMPNEALAAMMGFLQVDSLQFTDGQLKYYEKYAVNAVPGLVTIDNINASVSGIANHVVYADTAIIRGEGLLMNSCQMKLLMAIPLTSTDFSLRYSGSFGRLDVTQLNPFFEPAEQLRFKSGILQQATFDIVVNSGHATGGLRAVYRDLSIAVINKTTGSERGLFNRISTLFGKLFVVRGTNKSVNGIVMKIGKIEYTRNPDDSFVRFVWFALRSGVCDVVKR